VPSRGSVVIVRGGLAGASTAFSLRGQGFAERVILIGDEHLPPYERPPLSKTTYAARRG
jgi:3-phenylpropionate/trans-cinnamate dioxygenase ferredoxin reductase component